jgi:hypothetical protein
MSFNNCRASLLNISSSKAWQRWQEKLNQQGKALITVLRSVLLSPGHAYGKKAEPDTSMVRHRDEVEQPSRQLGIVRSASSKVVAKANGEPVRGIVGLLHLL